MIKISPLALALSVSIAAGTLAGAQDAPASGTALPNVLQITREYTKPGKGGARKRQLITLP
jgi:hypothetical protein